jgi:hypothetical protein
MHLGSNPFSHNDGVGFVTRGVARLNGMAILPRVRHRAPNARAFSRGNAVRCRPQGYATATDDDGEHAWRAPTATFIPAPVAGACRFGGRAAADALRRTAPVERDRLLDRALATRSPPLPTVLRRTKRIARAWPVGSLRPTAYDQSLLLLVTNEGAWCRPDTDGRGTAMIVSRARMAATVRRPKGAPAALREILALSKRPTRLELVCWELNVDQRLARPAWELALQNDLLDAGVDAATGKTMFTLSERGRFALRRLGRRRSPIR